MVVISNIPTNEYVQDRQSRRIGYQKSTIMSQKGIAKPDFQWYILSKSHRWNPTVALSVLALTHPTITLNPCGATLS